MIKSKLMKCAEGLIVAAAGALFVVLSLGIRNNPVSVEGAALSFVVQAKFFPLVLSALILLQGVLLTLSLLRGKDTTKRDKTPIRRPLIVVTLTVAYLLLVSLIGFAVPTVVYICALLFVVNHGQKPLLLLGLTLLYSVITLWLIPELLNLSLL